MYTSLFLLIVFVALSSTITIFDYDGKIYLDSDYELVYGGKEVLKINQNTIRGLKSYRKLTGDEKIAIQKQKELYDIQQEIDSKRRLEERERKQKLRDEEKNSPWKQQEIKLQSLRKQREIYLKKRDEEKRRRDELIRQIYEKRRQRDEERSQRGLPRYGANSYIELRPMRKAQREKELQQHCDAERSQSEAKEEMQNSLVQQNEQEHHSDEDGAEECPVLKAKNPSKRVRRNTKNTLRNLRTRNAKNKFND